MEETRRTPITRQMKRRFVRSRSTRFATFATRFTSLRTKPADNATRYAISQVRWRMRTRHGPGKTKHSLSDKHVPKCNLGTSETACQGGMQPGTAYRLRHLLQCCVCDTFLFYRGSLVAYGARFQRGKGVSAESGGTATESFACS